jgi:hypothetical protein
MTGEKRVLESKKFIAYLIAELTWKGILFTALLLTGDVLGDTKAWMWWFLVVVVLVAGFMEAGFIGSQAWLDRYTHLAQTAMQKPGEVPIGKKPVEGGEG